MTRRMFGLCAVLALPAVASACSAAMRRGTDTRDYAYARAGDSLIAGVSAHGRTRLEIQNALHRAIEAAASKEGCAPVRESRLSDHDPRLDPQALAYLKPPYAFEIASCNPPSR